MNKTMLKEMMNNISGVYSKMSPALMDIAMNIEFDTRFKAAFRYEQKMARLKSKALVRKFEEEFDSEQWCNELDSVGYGWRVFY